MEISNEDLTAIIRTAIEGAAVDRIVKEAKTNIDSTIYPGGLSPADVEVRLADLEARQQVAGGNSDEEFTGPFRLDGRTVRDCILYFGRARLETSDTQVSLAAGTYIYAEILHATADGTPVMHVTTGSYVPSNNTSAFRSYVKLYWVDSNSQIHDYRAAPVLPAFYY